MSLFACTFKVFQVTHGAEEVVCKGGAADVAGQMRLKLVFFKGAGVDVAVSFCMQPSQAGFHIEKEKKWGKERGYLPGSYLSLLVFDLCRPLKEA